jgi:hypothetical protein
MDDANFDRENRRRWARPLVAVLVQRGRLATTNDALGWALDEAGCWRQQMSHSLREDCPVGKTYSSHRLYLTDTI